MNYNQQTAIAENKEAHKLEYQEIAKLCNNIVLDFGCNTMQLKEYLKSGISYYGTDIIKQESIDESLFIPIDDLSNKRFDTIVLNHVIEHLASPINTLITLYNNNLNLNGNMIIITPNLCSFKRSLAVLIGHKLGTDKEHIHGWSYPELEILGSKISNCYYVKVFPKLSKELLMLIINKEKEK